MAFEYLDKRVQRTKLDLYKALTTLLNEKKYEQITIKEIIDLAGYSRGTFYLHYSQKDDLLNEMIHFLFDKLKKAAKIPYLDQREFNAQLLEDETMPMLTHFKEYGDYYKSLLSENITMDFSRKLTNFLIDLFIEEFDMEAENITNRSFLNKYYAYGTMGLMIEWIVNDFPIDAQEFSKELEKTYKHTLGNVRIKK